MAKVEITHDHVVHATPSINVLYRAGTTVPAPRHHIDEIVAAGHGRRVEEATKPAPQAPSDDRPPEAA